MTKTIDEIEDDLSKLSDENPYKHEIIEKLEVIRNLDVDRH